MPRKLSTKINPFAISCHFAPDGRPLCGASPDMHDTGNRSEYAQHPGACPTCRGLIATLDAVEAAAKGLAHVGFPLDGDAIRALRKGNASAVRSAATSIVEQVERVAKEQAFNGAMPRWYIDAAHAAATFASVVSALPAH